MRLDKFISDNSALSRSQVRNAVKKGLVKVDGIIIKQADFKISPETSSVEYAGNIISYRKNRYILLNKPAGFVCSTNDPESHNLFRLNFQKRFFLPEGLTRTRRDLFF